MQAQQERISLVNGRIHTPLSTASNITFEHGRIVSIDDESSSLNGKIIDLHGRTVLPGFCDSGLNFLSWAESQERLSLANVKTLKELSDSLKAYTSANPKPLRGWYIAYDFPENIIIPLDELDSVVPSMPCALITRASSQAILNSQAMNAFNMPQNTVELDEFTQHLPVLSDEDILYLVKTYAPKINALGLTELWMNFTDEPERLWEIFSTEAYYMLTFRLRCNFGFDDVTSLNEFLSTGLRTGDGLPFCKLGGILVRGIDQTEQNKEPNKMIYSAHLSGCQVISDNNKSCLNALERVIKKSRKNSRHLINNFSGSILDRMNLLGLGGIITAGQENKDVHEAFQNGLVISSGSGETLTPPLKIISSLVSKGLSVSEALSVSSWGAAWNGGNDSRRGEIAVGNDADFVILEQDPFLVSPEEIAAIDVTMTFCAGCAVYNSGAI